MPNRNEMDESFTQDPPEVCYKVLYRCYGQLVSITGSKKLFANSLTYTPLERVVPKIGKLFVFKDLIHAEFFWRHNVATEEIWLAHGENLVPGVNIIPWAFIDERLSDFWRTYGSKDEHLRDYNYEIGSDVAPIGTYLSDSVTIIKRVD